MARNPLCALLLLCCCVAQAQPYRIYRYRPYPPTPTPRTTSRSAPSQSSSSSTPDEGANVITRPATISAPGSYVLGANINSPDSLTTGAVVITVSNVTLDLGGFAIRGRNAESPDACGVAVLAGNVTIRNGNISEFDRENQCGVLVGSGVVNFSLESLAFSKCETGIILNSDNSDPASNGRIDHCRISGGAIGLLAFESSGVSISGCEITGAAVRHNLEGEGSGMLLRGDAFHVSNCMLTDNAHGIRLEAGNSLLENVICSSNRNTGMVVIGSHCVVRDSVFSGNGMMGTNVLGTGTRLEDSTFSKNGGHGITLDSREETSARGTWILRCQIDRNNSDGVRSSNVQTSGADVNIVDSCHVTGNGGAGLGLRPEDVYRGNFLGGNGTPVQGGKDGGGNHI